MARNKEFDPDDALERAMQVFWRHGYANTTMSMLVEATGVVRASLYATFGNKAALFRRALDRYGALRAGVVDPDAGPLGMLRQYLEAAIVDADGGSAGCLLFATTAEYHTLDPALRAEVDAHLARVEAFFRFCVGALVPAAAVERQVNVLVGANAAVFTLARIGAPAAQLRDIIDAALAEVMKST